MRPIRCRICRHGIGKVQDGKIKVRTLLAFSMRAGKQVCETSCPKCGTDVELPITVDAALFEPPTAPVPTPTDAPRLILAAQPR